MPLYEVIAYETKRYVFMAEANSPEDAQKIADGFEPHVSSEWEEDWEYHNFKIVDVVEVEDD